MTLAEFKVQYPEFTKAGDSILTAFLSAAALQLSPAYWTTYYDQGHGLLTAALLADSPNGQNARLQSDKGTSTYRKQYERLLSEITFADRVM